MFVTPCAGVWIEIFSSAVTLVSRLVTPCAGVWIEISEEAEAEAENSRSLPVRECGLKCLLWYERT